MSDKKHKCPEFENHERWLISYADMLTLLFAVFVTLYALKEDGEKAQDVAGSLQESFSKPMEDIPMANRIGPNQEGFGIFEHMKGNSARPPISKKFFTKISRVKIIDEEAGKMRKEIEDRLYGENQFRKDTEPGFERIISIHKVSDGFKVTLLAKHFFESGDTKVKQSALRELDLVIDYLKNLDRPITVEGHTDSIPPIMMSNWRLSTLRATNILEYMISRHNFPTTRLSAVGYADTKPMASNATENGRALNRRIEFKVHYNNEDAVDSE
ncbi:MAG: flagellar motor protein MotB [Oligoflexales bacterium]|nr:flagellar motor protein MotB [Oligoflexales bacterium]